jgi:O-antigen/teichoic acid export membrane protein
MPPSSQAISEPEVGPELGSGTGSTARRSLHALIGLVGSAGLTFVALLALVRTLEPSQYGLFALGFAINQVAFVVADAGLASSTARALAAARTGEERARAASSGLAIKGGVSIAVALILALAAPVIASAYDHPDLEAVLRATAVALAAQSIFMLYRHSLNAVGATRAMLGLVLGESAIEAVAVVGFAVAGGTAAAAMSGRAVGFVVGAGLGFVLLRRRLGPLPTPSAATARSLAAYGLTLAIADGAFLLFTQIDVLLIGALRSARDVALFEAPARLLVVAGYLGYAVALSVAPRLARAAPGQARGTLVGAVRTVSTAQGAILLVWLALIVPNAVRIFGARYAPSGDVLLVLSPYLLLAGAAPLLSLAATYAGAGRLVVVASCAALAVNAAIDVALLRAHGILVAAVATDVAFALFVALLLRGCATTFGFGFGRAAAGGARLLVALVPALVVLGGLLALGPVAAAVGLLPALGLYLGGLHLTGLLAPQLGTAWRRTAADCDPGGRWR